MGLDLEKEESMQEQYGEDWLGGEAHTGLVDPQSAFLRVLNDLRENRSFLLSFGFASGLLIGTGLAVLLSRRRG